MRIAWLTDVHFNHLKPAGVCEFLASVADQKPDAVLIGCDIAEAPTLSHHFRQLSAALACPVYFVLGNHDFYCGSIQRVRAEVACLTIEDENLAWLNAAGVVELTPSVGLVGHDGWADGRLGAYETSTVLLNDYVLIQEFRGLDSPQRREVLHALGDQAAAAIVKTLHAALERYPHVVLLTHVPPFRDACWHEGSISDDEWLPHFSCQVMGDTILRIITAYPQRKLTILCGHTHSPGECRPLDNLTVLTGGAVYGAPEIQQMFDWE